MEEYQLACASPCIYLRMQTIDLRWMTNILELFIKKIVTYFYDYKIEFSIIDFIVVWAKHEVLVKCISIFS